MVEILNLFPFFLQLKLNSLQTGERYLFDIELISKNFIHQKKNLIT